MLSSIYGIRVVFVCCVMSHRPSKWEFQSDSQLSSVVCAAAAVSIYDYVGVST